MTSVIDPNCDLRINERVTDICRDVLEEPLIGIDDELDVFGAKSLTRIVIVSRLSAEFGVEFPPAAMVDLLYRCPSARALSARVMQLAREAANPPE